MKQLWKKESWLVLTLLLIAGLSGCNLFTPTPTPTLHPPTPTLEPTSTPTTAPPDLDLTPEAGLPVLINLDMIDGNTGWGLSEGGVYRTLNGTVSWLDATPPGMVGSTGYPVAEILDALTAWVIVPAQGDFQTGQLYHTVDGGETWATYTTPNFGYLYFLDANLGFGLYSEGAGAGSMAADIYKTTDGGQTWTLQGGTIPGSASEPGVLPFSGQKNGVVFLDENTGWVTGSIPMDNTLYVYRSTDGGVTWNAQSPVVPEILGTYQGEAQPPVIIDGIVYLPARLYLQNGQATIIFRSTDGGVTWQATTATPLGGQVRILSDTEAIVWGGAALTRTVDGFQTWEIINPDIDISLNFAAFDFVTIQQGWALATYIDLPPALYQTFDGGVTWGALY